MTQRTINLYDGLEALYYFDSDYYDGTTGEIKDKSGHGRHATANGGPTVGVNGPNDFEAANFSGSNSGDKFDTSTVFSSETQSYAFLFKPKDFGSSYYVFGDNRFFLDEGVVYRRNGSGNLTFRIVDGDGNVVNTGLDIPFDEWHFVYCGYDGSKVVQTTLDKTGINSAASGFTPSNDSLQIGDHPNNGVDSFPGEFAFFGKWDRTLFRAEIEALTDLTAPRRAQL